MSKCLKKILDGESNSRENAPVGKIYCPTTSYVLRVFLFLDGLLTFVYQLVRLTQQSTITTTKTQTIDQKAVVTIIYIVLRAIKRGWALLLIQAVALVALPNRVG